MRKSKKWLEYFKDQMKPSDQFYEAMLDQVPNLFEEMTDKKFDWKKLWLFVEPIKLEKVISSVQLEDYYSHSIKISLKFNHYGVSGILNYQMTSDNILAYQDEQNHPVVFSLSGFEKSKSRFDLFPFMEKRSSPSILFDIKGIKVYYEDIPHEGFFILHSKNKLDDSDLQNMHSDFDKIRDQWNNDNSQRLFHTISYDASKTEMLDIVYKYYFYFDMGSANIDAIKYILKAFIEMYSRINKIEIDGL